MTFEGEIPSPTQANLVLDHLRRRRSITQKEAWEEFGISDLAGRIRDLKKPRYGCVFEHEDEQGKNRFGKRVSFRRYVLVSENPEIEAPHSPPPTPTLSLGITPKPKPETSKQSEGQLTMTNWKRRVKDSLFPSAGQHYGE